MTAEMVKESRERLTNDPSTHSNSHNVVYRDIADILTMLQDAAALSLRCVGADLGLSTTNMCSYQPSKYSSFLH